MNTLQDQSPAFPAGVSDSLPSSKTQSVVFDVPNKIEESKTLSVVFQPEELMSPNFPPFKKNGGL